MSLFSSAAMPRGEVNNREVIRLPRARCAPLSRTGGGLGRGGGGGLDGSGVRRPAVARGGGGSVGRRRAARVGRGRAVGRSMRAGRRGTTLLRRRTGQLVRLRPITRVSGLARARARRRLSPRVQPLFYYYYFSSPEPVRVRPFPAEWLSCVLRRIIPSYTRINN